MQFLSKLDKNLLAPYRDKPIQNIEYPDYQYTDIPDNIYDVQDDIINKVFAPNKDTKPFKVILPEINLLRKLGFALPREDFNTRLLRLLRIRDWDTYLYAQNSCF